MELKDLLKIDLWKLNPIDPELFNSLSAPDLTDVIQEVALLASAHAPSLGASLSAIVASCTAFVYQDEDAHETCSLTACLNPLHPGPCKGWKGTLHSVSPGAWHALEAARVEKANNTRIKKIEALKSAGKPIPHKLLQPIVAKTHPDAGKTASKATGEAHAAGKAVSDAAGVHVNEPGKVTLGQAVKAMGTGEKGPKGKKPTVASKGIAFVIAQEKVTPQYKLDKAAAITPEQWAALPHADKTTIRNELAKISIEASGPQEEKANQLLAKLSIKTPASKAETKLGAKHESKVSAHEAKISAAEAKLAEVNAKLEAHQAKPKLTETYTPKAKAEAPAAHEPSGPTSAAQGDALHATFTAVFGPGQTSPAEYAAAFDKMKKGGGPVEDHPAFKSIVNIVAQKALKTATADNMPGLGHGSNDVGITEFNHEIRDHIKEGKPGLPPLVAKMAAHHEAVKSGNASPGVWPPEVNAPEDVAKAKVDAQEAKAAVEAHQVKPTPAEPTKLSEIATPNAAVTTGGKLATPAAVEALSKALDNAKPKPLPKHVEDAISMAKGQAPGASWAKHQLTAYQPLTAEEFHALPKEHQDKIVSDLKKGEGKFLDPKKVVLTKALLSKFGHGEGPKPPAPKPSETPVDFAKDLHNHSVTPAQAKEAVEKTAISGHFIAAKQSAGLTDPDNPDGGWHALNAVDDAKALVDLKTKGYGSVLGNPDVKAAMEALTTAAAKQSYAQSVHDAKSKAFNKISLNLTGVAGLSPIEKASLLHYQKHLVGHHVKTDTATLDALKADTKQAQNELDVKLAAAQKLSSAPGVDAMSNAQITDRATELLGENASVQTNMNLAELQLAKKISKAQVAPEAGKYSPDVLNDPSVASKYAHLESVNMQLLVSKQELHKLDTHIKNVHEATIISGHDINGNPLTAEDKKVIAKHAGILQADHSHLTTTLAAQEAKQFPALDAFHAAASKAQANLKPAGPVQLSDYDQGAIHEAYAGAWGKTASKAVAYGIKTYGTTTQMKAHPDYPALTQELGNLKQLAGKIAVATGAEHTAEQNVPTDPDTGALEPGPELNAWAAATKQRQQLEAEFKSVHASAQTKVDAVRASVGLKKRALPKFDAPAVKTMAAESGYYKTGGYGGPNYGKPSSAKGYMLAKVGPKLGVAHQTSGEKKSEKLAKVAATAGPMPAPKVHVKPPSSETGKAPNPSTAYDQGYHYVDKVADNQHGWTPGSSPAYVSSPEGLKTVQEHLAAADTKFGLDAQKQFKWSIDNMVGKGGSSSGKGALNSYTGGGYDPVNTKLNGLPPGTKKTGSGTITSIDAAMAASPPMEGDVVLYRGFKDPHGVFKSGKWNDVNVAGMEWSQRSYSSTSGQLSTAQSFGYGGVVMRVIIPKEMQVHGINAKGGQHTHENEIILQRGLRYRVVADYGKHSGARYIDVMVVPSPYDQPE